MRSVLLAMLLIPAVARADVPSILPYQGRLIRSDGEPVVGFANLRFSLFAAATGGGALWCEQDNVALTDGYYAITLGEGSACPGSTTTGTLGAAVDGTDRFLEIAVEGIALAPRQRVGSVPYAFLSSAAQSVVGGAVRASSITVSPGGTVSVGGAPVIDASGALTGSAAYSPGTGLELSGGTFSMLKSCAANQVLKWNGSAWACADLPSSYAQLEGLSQTFAANSWTGISFNAAPVARGISISGRNLTFAKAGTYLITVTFRMDESCGDVWTAARLYGNLVDVGHSAGSGTVAPGPATYSFLASVTVPGANHQIQVGRNDSACAVSSTREIGDTTPPAIQVTIIQVG